MERKQQDWFSIFDHHRQLMDEKLALLLRFEQFLRQLPAAEFTTEQLAVLAADIVSTRNALAYLVKCQQEAAEEKLKLGLGSCAPNRQKKSRNRSH